METSKQDLLNAQIDKHAEELGVAPEDFKSAMEAVKAANDYLDNGLGDATQKAQTPATQDDSGFDRLAKLEAQYKARLESLERMYQTAQQNTPPQTAPERKEPTEISDNVFKLLANPLDDNSLAVLADGTQSAKAFVKDLKEQNFRAAEILQNSPRVKEAYIGYMKASTPQDKVNASLLLETLLENAKYGQSVQTETPTEQTPPTGHPTQTDGANQNQSPINPVGGVPDVQHLGGEIPTVPNTFDEDTVRKQIADISARVNEYDKLKLEEKIKAPVGVITEAMKQYDEAIFKEKEKLHSIINKLNSML